MSSGMRIHLREKEVFGQVDNEGVYNEKYF